MSYPLIKIAEWIFYLSSKDSLPLSKESVHCNGALGSV